jgi:hypothetical protein
MEIELKSELAERAWDLEQRLNQCLVAIRENYLELGLVASALKAGKLYKLVCPEAQNWPHYLSLKCVGLKRAQIDNLADISKTIGVYIKDSEIDVTRALDITRIVRALPAPEREDKARELIGSAEIMPPAAWKDTIRECKGMITSEECDHPEEFRKHKELCTKCGGWVN